MIVRKLIRLIVCLFASAQAFGAPPPGRPFEVGPQVLPLLGKYCHDCHEEGTEKGDVRLDNLESLTLDARLDLLNRVQKQVYIGEMPPKKKNQPTEAERENLLAWLSAELRAHNASKLEDKLRMPEYGNVVNHAKLFSGQYKDLPGFTNDRRWLVSDFIFDAKINRLLDYNPSRDIDRKRQPVIGDNNRGGIKVNVTNPFLLPNNSGVRYYDTATLDGGHLLTMITNAKELAPYLVNQTRAKNNIPAINSIMAAEWAHQKTLAAREGYLRPNIEELLRDLYKERNDALLPVFVPSKRPPGSQTSGPDGKSLKKPIFDNVKPSNEELDLIVATIAKLVRNEDKDDALILRCEKEWFILGLDQRHIEDRVHLMKGYLEDLMKRVPKAAAPRPVKPPAEPELSLIRAAVLKHRKAGDTHNRIITKCLDEWQKGFEEERRKAGPPSEAVRGDLVDQLFSHILERAPTPAEKAEYIALTKSYLAKLGNGPAIEKLLQTVLLRTDFVYRQEFGEGQPDQHGRRMLSPRDASRALSYALTDSSPDKELQEAVKNGKLSTRDDYRREVERMLKNRSRYYLIDEAVEKAGGSDSFTNLPIRKLRFFREFFGYPALLSIFKDNKRFGGDYITVSGRLVSEADMLVEHILKEDKNVLEKLLGTEEFYVFHSGDNEAMAAGSAYVRKIYDYFKDKDWRNMDAAKLKEHLPFLKENEVRGVNAAVIASGTGGRDAVGGFKTTMDTYEILLGKGQANAVPFSATPGHGRTEGQTRTGNQLRAPEVAKTFNLDLNNWDYPTTQPFKVANRKGILTHPAWLIAFARNTETDPIHRGKWVREKLLAGTIPDVPITVDAVLPDDPHKTLRQRLEKATHAEYCWNCHERMNPLGTAFEMFDDFGRFRTEEALEHPENLVKKMPDKGPPQADLRDLYKTLPVVTTGRLEGTGDPALDGDVRDAIDLATRLAKSAKVRQSIIRHAFRYFMGRNEFLSDSKTLMDAEKAYLESAGSFDAVIVSLLTSDSFIYRKPTTTN